MVIDQVTVFLGSLSWDQLGDRPPEFVWLWQPPAPLPGNDVAGEHRPDPCMRFAFSVPATIGREDLEAKVRNAEAHVRELLEKERAQLLEVANSLELARRQSINEICGHCPIP